MLVVEDEEPLADAVARGLRREGMAVDVAYDGDGGHEKATLTRYDVVVLDRDLPGMSGDESVPEIVASGALTRVLMLTASGSVADRVEGLSLGADDYLAKPFAFPELVARVRALARRATPATPPVLVAGDVELDPAKRTVTPGRHADRADPQGVRRARGAALGRRGGGVSSEELLERVWDENADPFTTTVRVTVMTLRRKLGEPGMIETVVGSGYRVPAAAGSPVPALDSATGARPLLKVDVPAASPRRRGPGLRLRITTVAVVIVAAVSALLLWLGWLLVGLVVRGAVPQLPASSTIVVDGVANSTYCTITSPAQPIV